MPLTESQGRCRNTMSVEFNTRRFIFGSQIFLRLLRGNSFANHALLMRPDDLKQCNDR